MALKIGALEADIVANTSQLSKAEDEVRKTAKVIDSEMEKTNKATQRRFKTTGEISTDVLAKMRARAEIEARAINRSMGGAQAKVFGLRNAANAASSALANNQFAVRQLGFQVQDVAVQLQSGTNAMTVLSQQGSQIASIFGPGGAVIGAFLAVGSAIIGSLLPSLLGAKDSTEDLEEAIESFGEVAESTGVGGVTTLTEKIQQLAKESEKAAQLEISGGILKGLEVIDQAGQLALETMSDLFSASTAGGAELLIGEAGTLATKLGISVEQAMALGAAFTALKRDGGVDNMVALQEAVDDLATSADTPELINLSNNLRVATREAQIAGGVIKDLEAIQEDLNDALEKSSEEYKKRQAAIERQIASLTVEAETYGKSRTEVELYKAALLGATEAEKEEIRTKSEQIEKLREEEQARKDATKAAEKAAAEAKRASERAAKEAQRAQEKALQDEARRQKSAAPKLEKLSRLNDTELEAIAKQEEDRRDFVLQQTQITAEEQAALLEVVHENRILQEEALYEKLAQIATNAAEKQAKLQATQQANMLSGLAGLGSAANDVVAATGAEGTAIAKAIFLAQKAIYVAQIIAATEAAAYVASAHVAGAGPLAWLASKEGIRAIGYSSAALVAGLSVGSVTGGGRQFGGSTFPSLAHPINEAGVPEILNQGGKQFLLPTGKTGNITPLDKGGSGGGQPNVTVLNSGPPLQVDGVRMSDNEIAIMVRSETRQVKREINAELSTGRGDTSAALKRGFNVPRNL